MEASTAADDGARGAGLLGGSDIDRARLGVVGFILVLLVVLIAFEGLHEVAQRGLTGLSLGAIYALGAVGLTLVYGILKLVNFAHGDFLTFGAYMAYLVNVTWGLPFALAVVFAMAATALLGVSLEKVMWAPMRRKGAGMLQLLLMAIGLAFVLRYSVQFIWGTELRYLDVNNSAVVEFLGLRIGAHEPDRASRRRLRPRRGGADAALLAARQAHARPLRQPRPRGDRRASTPRA